MKTEKEKELRRAQAVIISVLMLITLACALFGGSGDIAGSEEKYALSSDLNGHTLAMVTGSEYAELALGYFPDSKMKYVTDWADTSLMVTQGKAEGFLTESADAAAVLEKYPALTALPDAVTHMEYSFLTQKNEEGKALAAEFNAFLSEYKLSGQYDLLHNK